MNRGKPYRLTPLMRRRNRLRPVLVIALAAGLVFSVTGLALYFAHSANNRAEQTELAATHQAAVSKEQTVTPDMQSNAPSSTPSPAQTTEPFFQVIGLTRDAYKPIAARNEDAVGWISIEGLVDQPIVYRNNTFYLTHDFNQNQNVCGAVFLDEGHPLQANSQNLLLYGHNMKDESMFGPLLKYMQANFLRAHLQITLETRFETFTYLIFAVDKVSMDATSPQFLYFWGHATFGNSKAFQSYIDEVYQKSLYTRFLDVDATDTLLTLVTCIGEDRLVLLARRQRLGETAADIQSALLALTMR